MTVLTIPQLHAIADLATERADAVDISHTMRDSIVFSFKLLGEQISQPREVDPSGELLAPNGGVHRCPSCGTSDPAAFADERGGLAGYCDRCAPVSA